MEVRTCQSRELVKHLAVAVATAIVSRAAKLPIAGLSKWALLWLPADGAPRIFNEHLKLLVSPSEIRGEAHIPAAKKRWFMPSGEWDLNINPATRTTSYRIMEAVFTNGTSFQTSSIYQELLGAIRHKGVVKLKTDVLLRSEEELTTYMRGRLELLNELGKIGVSGSVHEPVRVAIGRNRDIVKVSDGRHRISAAQLLNLRQIWVTVAYLHPDLISLLPRTTSAADWVVELLRSYEPSSDSFSLADKDPACAVNARHPST